jgi:hypothetical protein
MLLAVCGVLPNFPRVKKLMDLGHKDFGDGHLIMRGEIT